MRLEGYIKSVRERLAFRPEVMRLESREVPGQTTGASMLWATGLGAAGLLSREAGGLVSDNGVRGAVVRDAFSGTDATDDASMLSITPGSDGYWTAQPVQNFGAARADAPAATDIVFSDSDLAESFTPAGPSVPTAGVSFPSFNEHAVTLSGGAASAAPFSNGSTAAPVFALPASDSADMQDVAADLAAFSAAADIGGNEPLLTVRAGKITPNVTPSGFSPAQIRHAYGFDQLTQTGAGQSVWIVDAYNDPNIASDLQTFDAQFGLANPTLNVIYPQGKPRNNGGWAQEISLDVEWAHAIAPGATINLVETASNSNTNLYGGVDYAVNHGATVVSMSWGASDSSGEASLDSHFNHSGVAFFASSGDTGGKVIYPSASPYVVSCGGTSLHLDSSGNYSSESAWSSGGGGASLYESEPGYQTSYGISLSGRGTPDISYNSDPNTGFAVYDSYSYRGLSGWLVFGGTSCAAPQLAAMAALVDQSRSTPLSSANLTSRFDYNAATGTAYASNYHDVTTGSNGYAAGPGYDLATGLGSPQANNLVPYLISH